LARWDSRLFDSALISNTSQSVVLVVDDRQPVLGLETEPVHPLVQSDPG
jgi:hypothetical protein